MNELEEKKKTSHWSIWRNAFINGIARTWLAGS